MRVWMGVGLWGVGGGGVVAIELANEVQEN